MDPLDSRDGELMSAGGYDAANWSTEELQRRVSLYQTKGRFDPSKIYVSSAADIAFAVCLIIAALVFVAEFFIFLSMGRVWSGEHFIAMGMFEIYPLIGAGAIGLYVLGHRYDETMKYYRYKKILKAREKVELSHEQTEKYA